jgi:WXG100 family type VII secretion target
MGVISTTNEGMIGSAIEMRARMNSINNVIQKMQNIVDSMQYDSASATKFRAAMKEWDTKAKTITKGLDDMAYRLDGGAKNIVGTEENNQVLGSFF